MPSDKPSSIFLQDVMAIGEQLTLLSEHRKGLLEANTMVAFQNALDRFHLSMEVLQVCVSSLTHKAILIQRDTYQAIASGETQPDTPPGISGEAAASTEADTRGGLIKALLKKRGLG
jgi:hypothetical protein